MKHGNWIPITKEVVKYLPKDRAFTKLEALISIQYDFDCGNEVTIAGYSTLWKWSRNKVVKFLKDIGADIIYAENTKKKQNQKGQIAIQILDRKRTDQGQIRLINSKPLASTKDRSGTEKGQKKDRSRLTTNKPNPKPDPKPNNVCSFFDPQKFKEKHLKAGKNINAINLAIKQAEEKAINNKEGYAEKVLEIQNGNFNEKETPVHENILSVDTPLPKGRGFSGKEQP